MPICDFQYSILFKLNFFLNPCGSKGIRQIHKAKISLLSYSTQRLLVVPLYLFSPFSFKDKTLNFNWAQLRRTFPKCGPVRARIAFRCFLDFPFSIGWNADAVGSHTCLCWGGQHCRDSWTTKQKEPGALTLHCRYTCPGMWERNEMLPCLSLVFWGHFVQQPVLSAKWDLWAMQFSSLGTYYWIHPEIFHA